MMGDGHLNQCKECVKARVSEHRVANVDRIRAYDRERNGTEKRRVAFAARQRRMRAENPHLVRAHNAVARAVRRGDLIRPAGCE